MAYSVGSRAEKKKKKSKTKHLHVQSVVFLTAEQRSTASQCTASILEN